MSSKRFLRSGLAGLAVVCALSFAPASASAQAVLFDWGSNETVNDSGREMVRFDSKSRVGELIVSFGDRRVFLITGPGQALSYPIAIPREKSKWEGVTSVSQKRVNPSWTPTPDMIAENPRLPPWVPGGHPMNPLGTHALYLGSSSYRIHGTDAPWTIGTAASKGCVRMYNKDVQDLYPRVPVGTRVTVTYQTFKFSPMDGDRAKGILASLDKGRKSKSSDDVAETAAQNAKLWKEDGNDDGTSQKRASTSPANDEDQDKADTSSDEDKSKKSYGVAVRSKDGDSEQNNDEKAADATDERDDTALSKKRRHDQSDVETGSVGDTKKKVSSDDKAGDHEKSEKKPKLVSTEKSEDGDSPRAKKSAGDEDSALVAKRALAAAERAAAAAERAADAAERASAAVAKVTALEKKSDSSSNASESKPNDEQKAKEAAPLETWPVVR